MRRSDPSLVGPRGVAPHRRNHPGALAIFLVAYLGILGVVVAPEGALQAPPTPQFDRR
jgi:hypothetical protein